MSHQTYSNFVKSDNDLTGLVAYAIYKGDKNQFNDRAPPPSSAELNGFIQTINMPQQVEAYRDRAVALLEDMIEEATGEAIQEIENDFDNRLKAFERTLGFWRNVASNVIATLVAAVILVALTLFMYGNKLGFLNIFGDAMGYEIKPKVEQQQ